MKRAKWKQTRVTPVHKAGDKMNPENYRPISVVSTVMKTFEKFIHKQLYSYLNDNNLLTDCQSGFRPLHSTCSVLLDLNEYFLRCIDEGYAIGAIFLDLKRAFDTVNHNILFNKLAKYGVQDKELSWFVNYFSDREQCVCIKGAKSAFKRVSVGIPQGSLLGPLLFTIFVNDICCIDLGVDTKLCLYADDTAVFVRSKNVNQLSQLLQSKLDLIGQWLDLNCLVMNSKKTKVMLIGSKGRLKNHTLHVMHKGTCIEHVYSFKYLGVIIDSCLKWDKHINAISLKISRIIGYIRRIKHYLPDDVMRLLYNSLILPQLDYCNVVWGRSAHCHLDKLQKLQNRYARMILKADILTPHRQMLSQLQWQTVRQRVRYQCCVYLYKIINGMTPVYLKPLVIVRFTPFYTRYAFNSPLFVRTPRTDYYKKSFHYEVSTMWNNLPSFIRSAQSLSTFKKSCRMLSMIDRL